MSQVENLPEEPDSVVARIASTYRLFSSLQGYRLPLFMAIVVFSSLLEGIGFATLLPLLSPSDLFGQSFSGRVVESLCSTIGISPGKREILAIMAIIFCLRGVMKFLEMAVRGRILIRTVAIMRIKVMDLYIHQSWVNFSKMPRGELIALINSEVPQVGHSFEYFINHVVSLLSALAYATLGAVADPKLTAIGLTSFFVIALPLRKLMSYSVSLSREVSLMNTKLNELLTQAIGSFKYLKSRSNLRKISQRLFETVEALARGQIRINYFEAAVGSANNTGASIAVVAILYYFVAVQNAPISAVLFSLMLLYRSLSQLVMTVTYWQSFSGKSGHVEHVVRVLKDLGEHQEYNLGQEFSEKFYQLSLRGIQFQIENTEILKNISLEIKRGEFIGLAGKSGEGKTTLSDIVTGIIQPTSGMVLVNGRDLRTLQPHSWRSKIGMVGQASVIFSDTLFNNITLWTALSTDLEAVRKVEKLISSLGLESIVAGLPEGIFTHLGQLGGRSIELSGGQQQRIALARELFLNTEVLILDEATSALDPKTESLVRSELRKRKGTTASLLISHRVSLLKDCDRIYLISKGLVAGVGSYSKLLESRNPIFMEIFSEEEEEKKVA